MATIEVEAPHHRKIGTKQILTFVVGLVIVVGIFWFAIPHFADYSAVWRALRTLTPIEFWSLLAATVFNLVTYWLPDQAGVAGLPLPPGGGSPPHPTSA